MLTTPIARRAALLGAVLFGAAGCASLSTEPLAYVVFFTADSAQLDTPAIGVLEQVALAAKSEPRSTALVEGYADRAGTPQANQILSRLRAQVVADELEKRGVAKSRITLRPRGTAGGDPGIESRRVEVTLR